MECIQCMLIDQKRICNDFFLQCLHKATFQEDKNEFELKSAKTL